MLAKTHSAANNSQKINGHTAVLNYKVKIHSECRTFFFLWINLTMANNFLLMLLFHIKEAENDQQGQTGNGDEHANVEEGKNRVLLSVVTYEISSPRLCRVLCMILFFPFSFLYLIPFFIFFPVGEQIEMQVLEHNEIPEVEAPELPAPQPGQLRNIRVLMLTIKL